MTLHFHIHWGKSIHYRNLVINYEEKKFNGMGPSLHSLNTTKKTNYIFAVPFLGLCMLRTHHKTTPWSQCARPRSRRRPQRGDWPTPREEAVRPEAEWRRCQSGIKFEVILAEFITAKLWCVFWDTWWVCTNTIAVWGSFYSRHLISVSLPYDSFRLNYKCSKTCERGFREAKNAKFSDFHKALFAAKFDQSERATWITF